VQVKVDDFKAKETARRDERYKEQQKKRFEEGRGQDKKPGVGKAPAKLDEAKRAEVLASLPQEAQDRLGKLPAEQQDRLLARLAELPADRRAEALKRMAERGRGGQGRGGQGRGPQPGSDEQPK
jgi:acyl-CoA reductase-like NAD-dependent aldehyde dehydrogenase